MKQMKQILNEGFGINESNRSMLIFGLFGSLLTLWYTYQTRGVVDETFADVIKTLAYCVAGINSVKVIDGIVGKVKG